MRHYYKYPFVFMSHGQFDKTVVKMNLIYLAWSNHYDGNIYIAIHTAMTFTKVVFPEYCSPTSVNSISSFQNKLLNQSKIRFIKANIIDS